MSNEALAIAMNHSRAKGTARLVLFGIASHDGDGGSWPSVATLARYAGGVDARNVQRALQQLQQLGEVFVHRQAGGTTQTADHRRPNLYQFLLGCPSDCDGSKQHRTRERVLFDLRSPVEIGPPAEMPPPGASATPPPGASATPPPGASATRTTQENNPLKSDSPVAEGETSAREPQPVDNPAIRPVHWCRCDNGWLEPSPTAPDVPRPCLKCKPHLGRRVRMGVGR